MSQELDFLSRQVALGRGSRRDFLGRAAALGLSATAANLMLEGAAHAAGPVRGGTMRVGSTGGAATDSLDPALAAAQMPYFTNYSWGEVLVRTNPKGEAEGKLASEWSSSPDARVWTFKIRKGVQFHNGKDMTPADVVATLERHSGKDTKSGALGIMRGLESIKADGDTVVITSKDANADLPFLLSDYHLMIQPNGGKDAPTAAIGTGPYKKSVFEPGVRYVGTRFANYWAPDVRGFADELEILALNDNTARMAALQSGRVDMVNRVDPKIVDLLKRAPGVKVVNVSGKAFYCFLAFCDTAPFDNKDLRTALKYALNRPEMVDKILRGFGSVGNDQPINATYPMYSSDIEQRPFDLERARFYYKKSGHSGPLLLRTAEVAFPGAVDAAQLFQATAAKAGIQIEVKREPNDGYWSEVWNKKPFVTAYWGGRSTQDQMFSTEFISTADWNDTRFKVPKFDEMVAKARGELDQAKRKAMYRDIAVMVKDDGGAFIPMFNDTVEGIGPKVGGWIKHPVGELMSGCGPSECWVLR